MKKPEMYKCELCGEQVYKEYWQGNIMIRQVIKRKEGYESGPHTCNINFYDAICVEREE